MACSNAVYTQIWSPGLPSKDSRDGGLAGRRKTTDYDEHRARRAIFGILGLEALGIHWLFPPSVAASKMCRVCNDEDRQPDDHA